MENLLIYGSIFDSLEDLTNEEAGILFKALNSFRKGEEVEFQDRYLQGLWKGIKPNLDKLKENYDNKVKSNQENGKKGGRPKGTTKANLEARVKSSDLSHDNNEMIVEDYQEEIIQPEASIVPENRLSIDGFIKNCKYKYGSYIPDDKFDKIGNEIKEFGFNFVDEMSEEAVRYFNGQIDYKGDDGNYRKLNILK